MSLCLLCIVPLTGFEPAFPLWKSGTLPLGYSGIAPPPELEPGTFPLTAEC